MAYHQFRIAVMPDGERLPWDERLRATGACLEEFGSFEVFWLAEGELECDDEGARLPGWYWAAGFPGCVWDGEPNGPFDSEQEAIADAQNLG